mmetsp:Transcript_37995/g.89364  ORF Transcript_37995/g.89364 Transcript_37995/m.89364 type:complete len:214 (-) Transcript_37995:825-1466(-)
MLDMVLLICSCSMAWYCASARSEPMRSCILLYCEAALWKALSLIWFLSSAWCSRRTCLASWSLTASMTLMRPSSALRHSRACAERTLSIFSCSSLTSTWILRSSSTCAMRFSRADCSAPHSASRLSQALPICTARIASCSASWEAAARFCAIMCAAKVRVSSACAARQRASFSSSVRSLSSTAWRREMSPSFSSLTYAESCTRLCWLNWCSSS